jgi:hypothetical protein
MKYLIPLIASAVLVELDGAIKVNDFTYYPAQGVQPNQIPNTAAGSGLQTPEPLGAFFANAVRREFRQSGLSLKERNCKLDGEINKLLIDDLGFTVDFIADVRYVLRTKDDRLLADVDAKTGMYKMSKFTTPEIILNNINKMFSDNIAAFMNDDRVTKAIKAECK